MFLKFSILFSILLFFSLGVGVFVFKKKKFEKYLYFFETAEFSIVAGVIIGLAVNEKDFLKIKSIIYPVVIFLTSYIGFLFGLQIRLEELLKKYKSEVFLSVVNTLFVVIVGIVITKNIDFLTINPSLKENFLFSILVLSSLSFLSSFIFKYSVEKKYSLIVISTLNNLIIIVIFGILFSESSKINAFSHSFSPLFGGIVFSILIGIAIYSGFFYRLESSEVIAMTVGFILFCAGVSGFLKVPSVFLAFISGIVFSNLPKKIEATKLNSPYLLEKPIYILILFYLGFFVGTKSKLISTNILKSTFILVFSFFTIRLIFYLLMRVEKSEFKITDFLPVSSIAFVLLASALNEELLKNSYIVVPIIYAIVIVEIFNTYVFRNEEK